MIDGKRFEANPVLKGITATCPCCDSYVTPKCGSVVAWHWAHQSLDCDPWSEPESEWHREWKRCFPEAWQEVKIGEHRADVKTPNLVIELQNSQISPETIQERECFYGKMVWVVNAAEFNLDIRQRQGYATFRWKWPRKSWWSAGKPLFFDLGHEGILEVKKIYHRTPCGGWGKIHQNRIEFLKRIRVINEYEAKDFWAEDPELIVEILRGSYERDGLTDRERLVMFVGPKLANMVIWGECNHIGKKGIKCLGELKIAHYKWCNQYRIICDLCKTPLSVDGYNANAMPHRTAMACAKYLKVIDFENAESVRKYRDDYMLARNHFHAGVGQFLEDVL